MVDPLLVAQGMDLAITLIRAAIRAARQAGMTDEEINDMFELNYPKFMAETAMPVEDVKED